MALIMNHAAARTEADVAAELRIGQAASCNRPWIDSKRPCRNWWDLQPVNSQVGPPAFSTRQLPSWSGNSVDPNADPVKNGKPIDPALRQTEWQRKVAAELILIDKKH